MTMRIRNVHVINKCRKECRLIYCAFIYREYQGGLAKQELKLLMMADTRDTECLD